MNQSYHPRRKLTRAEIHRRRRNRAIRRITGLVLVVCVVVGIVSFLLTRHNSVPSASAASSTDVPASSTTPAANTAASSVAASESENTAPTNALGLTAAEAQAILNDPLMILVNHTNKMPDNYTFDNKE